MPSSPEARPVAGGRLLSWKVSALALLVLMSSAAAPATAAVKPDPLEAKLASLLPDSLPGWQAAGRALLYDSGSLYDYVNGAADTFLGYGFRLAAVRYYQPAAGEGRLSVDVFAMGSPLEAFGIYSLERSPDMSFLSLGRQGYLEPNLLAFWQGRHFVRVSALLGRVGKDDLLAFGRAVASRLPASGADPPELGLLPGKWRVANSEKFLPRDVLGRSFLLRALQADYRPARLPGKAEKPTSCRLLVILCDNPKQAARNFGLLRSDLMRSAKPLPAGAKLGDDSFAVLDPVYGSCLFVRAGSRLIAAIQVKEEPFARQIVELAIGCPAQEPSPPTTGPDRSSR